MISQNADDLHDMKNTANNKRSIGELKRLVGLAVGRVCGLPRAGLILNIDQVESTGRPPAKIRVWATLHFTKVGSPFCCGEPGCHIPLGEDGLTEIGEDVRRSMNLRHPVTVEFVSVGVQYHDGVEFHYGEGEEDA